MIKTSLKPVQEAESGSADSNAAPIHWTNRIHAQDCARVIQHVLYLPATDRKSLYIASDNLPVEKHRVANWIQSLVKGEDDAREPMAAKSIQTLETGKRCDNNRLLKSGFEFMYPTYREGFSVIVPEYLAFLEQEGQR